MAIPDTAKRMPLTAMLREGTLRNDWELRQLAADRILALEIELRDFKRLYRDEWGGEGQTDASFCAAYERCYLKHAK